MGNKKRTSDDEIIRLFNLYGNDYVKIGGVVGLHPETVRKRAAELHLVKTKRIITDEEIVMLHKKFNGEDKKIIEHTGLHRNTLRKRLKLLGLKFVTENYVSDKQIIEVCKTSSNMSEARRKVGMASTSFKRRAESLGVYMPKQGDLSNRKRRDNLGYLLEDILSGKHPQYASGSLRKRLIKEGIFKDECSKCGFNEHREGFEHSICQLHHINGNPRDHRLENLEILCPNCHALTPNFGFTSRAE